MFLSRFLSVPGKFSDSLVEICYNFCDNSICYCVRGLLLRLWETARRMSRAKVTVGSKILVAEEITLLEKDPVPLEYNDRTVTVPMKASQVKTIRISY